MTVLEVWMV